MNTVRFVGAVCACAFSATVAPAALITIDPDTYNQAEVIPGVPGVMLSAWGKSNLAEAELVQGSTLHFTPNLRPSLVRHDVIAFHSSSTDNLYGPPFTTGPDPFRVFGENSSAGGASQGGVEWIDKTFLAEFDNDVVSVTLQMLTNDAKSLGSMAVYDINGDPLSDWSSTFTFEYSSAVAISSGILVPDLQQETGEHVLGDGNKIFISELGVRSQALPMGDVYDRVTVTITANTPIRFLAASGFQGIGASPDDLHAAVLLDRLSFETIDNEPIPEPASMLVWGLLAAGGLGLVIRKRSRR